MQSLLSNHSSHSVNIRLIELRILL